MARWLTLRPRLAIRILADDVEKDTSGLVFEIENRSHSVTSLRPTIKSCFYNVSWESDSGRIVKGKMRYAVRELDRRLEPFKARTLTATPEKSLDAHIFSWFRTYTFAPKTKPATLIAPVIPKAAQNSTRLDLPGFSYHAADGCNSDGTAAGNRVGD